MTAGSRIREQDIVNIIGENSNLVRQHLDGLKRRGLIVYEPREIGKPYSIFKLSPDKPIDEPPAYEQRSALTKEVYGTILSDPNREWTSEAVVAAFASENPQREKKAWFRLKVSAILSYLAGMSYLQREGFSDKRQSEISINDEQRIIISDFLMTVDSFQDQSPDFLKEGKKLLQGIVSDPDGVARLMGKAKEHSPIASLLSHEQTRDDIASLISANPGITTHEITTGFYRAVSKATVGMTIHDLKQKGLIRVEVKGGLAHYYPIK